MKTFKLDFCHPVKGLARFDCHSDKTLQKKISLDTKDSNILEISLNGFKKGIWNVILEWEFEGKDYMFKEEINI